MPKVEDHLEAPRIVRTPHLSVDAENRIGFPEQRSGSGHVFRSFVLNLAPGYFPMVVHDHDAAWHRPPYRSKNLKEMRHVIDIQLIEAVKVSQRIEFSSESPKASMVK